MKVNRLLSTACIALCIGMIAFPPGAVKAQEVGTMHHYPLGEADYREHLHEWRVFLEYNLQREPCQKYVAPPDGYVMKGCDIYRTDSVTSSERSRYTKTTVVERTEPSVPYYAIHFDFDESDIRANERENLAEIARELLEYNLTEVSVSGHTDRSGTAEYNMRLSEKRARTVANALRGYGIKASVIDQYAYGETSPIDRLGDGVRSQENRRVIINYKR